MTAFEHIAHYDVIIENWLRKKFGNGNVYPEYLNLSFRKIQDMRYGENHHQSAAFYLDNHKKDPCIGTAEYHQDQGKSLSYNNILDANSALELVREFANPTVVIVKHNNPCGVASDNSLMEAYKKALAVDSEAAFGGVIATNRELDEKLAELIVTRFYEVIIAPSFSEKAV